MMNKKILTIFAIFSLFSISLCSAISVDYYYHPNCGHCNSISDFITNAVSKYKNVEWNIYDISTGSYNIPGTPTMHIFLDDCRKIELLGSSDIPNYLECELNEVSNKECVTFSASEGVNIETQSWFIR